MSIALPSTPPPAPFSKTISSAYDWLRRASCTVTSATSKEQLNDTSSQLGRSCELKAVHGDLIEGPASYVLTDAADNVEKCSSRARQPLVRKSYTDLFLLVDDNGFNWSTLLFFPDWPKDQQFALLSAARYKRPATR